MNCELTAERIAERAQWMLANAGVDPSLQPELTRQVIVRAAMELLPDAKAREDHAWIPSADFAEVER